MKPFSLQERRNKIHEIDYLVFQRRSQPIPLIGIK